MQSSETPSVVDGSGDTYHYLHGFANELASECLPGALPQGRNTPRKVPYQLYTEQLSGSAFTAPRQETRRTWLYRIQPSVTATNDKNSDINSQRLGKYLGHCSPRDCQPVVDALRWKPLQPPPEASESSSTTTTTTTTTTGTTDFWDSLQLHCHAGDPSTRQGLAIYQYASSPKGFGATTTTTTASSSYCNADGDFLIVPYQGTLLITTELGRLTVGPTEICVIPSGIVYSVVSLISTTTATNSNNKTAYYCAGYVLEIYSGLGFQLPELGPIGSNGLANARDFLHPVAWCVSDRTAYQQPHTIRTKQHSELFARTLDHSPYNVVAWHGNYLPYKYDLKRFCAVNSVTYDHLDPSLYTVLTCPSGAVQGTALADFVIFPPRVLATDANTLRPPWFHRNVMSEYMGLIYGQYDGKTSSDETNGGFQPGGSSLHNRWTPHGPDAVSYHTAVAHACTEPTRYDAGLAFMFETYLPVTVAPRALVPPPPLLSDNPWRRDVRYTQCWQDLPADQFEGWEALAQQQQQQQQQALAEPQDGA